MLLASLTTTPSSVQKASPGIPADRIIDWSHAGVRMNGVRGILQYPVGVTCVLPAYRVYPNQSTDSRAGIQAAIDACPAGRAVYLPAGTYRLSGQITLKSGIALRGAGAGSTVLLSSATNSIQLGALALSNATRCDIIGGVAKDATTVALGAAPPSACTVGGFIMIDELPDHDVIWVRDSYRGTDSRRHVFLARITAINGNQVSFTPPNPYPFKSGSIPQARFKAASRICSLSGVEALTVSGSTDRGLYFCETDRCWSKNVEVTGFQGGHGMVQINRSLQTEIRGCYIHDCADYPAQPDGYGIMLFYDSCFSLIEDNIFDRTAAAIIGEGTSGNVYGYNFMRQVGRISWPVVMYGINGNHGPFGTMSLTEGNIMCQFENDGYHGSSSHQTLFRNSLNGLSYDGYTRLRWLVNLARASYYHNCVGNVLGDPSWAPNKYEMTVANGGGGYDVSCVYKLEYPNDGNTDLVPATTWTNWTAPFPDARVRDTLIRHANYDYYNKAVVYEPGKDPDIPDSLYYSSKPSWFGSLDWPAIGPDVAGLMKSIPAKLRWDTHTSTRNLPDLFPR